VEPREVVRVILGRRWGLIAFLGLGLALMPGRAGASGGGGCGEPITSASGTDIDISNYCFSPTVLYADVGDTVTWTNLDSFPHSVGGANMAWGSFGQFREGHAARYSFSAPGVYSYVCTVHPGMVGTVVVGDPAPGQAIVKNSVKHVKTVSAVQTDPVEQGNSKRAALLLGATALVLVACWAIVRRKVVRRTNA
jgi:plastocyanin